MIERSRQAAHQARVRHDTRGIKMLIVAASLAATLGGWALLSTPERDDPVFVGKTSVGVRAGDQQPALRRVEAPAGPPRAAARTRSSR